jgi:hypothetical protein
MKLTRHQTAAAFLVSAQAALEQHEAANNLMLSIAMRLKEHPDQIQHPPYLATVAEGERLLAAAVMTPPHRVIIHGESSDPAPLRLLAKDLRRFDWQPLGAIGSAEAAHAFATVWISMAGGKFRLLRHERVYELLHVIHPTGVSGRLRVATEADIVLVAEWLQAFH